MFERFTERASQVVVLARWLGGEGGRSVRHEPLVALEPRTLTRRHEASIRVIGWLMFATPLGVGVLIGWAIWGH